MRDRLPLNALQAFEQAARAGSFAAAAQELGVSPAAVSQHIRLLEDRFGKQVFFRRANGVELTDAGRELFLRVAGAFAELTEAAAHLKTSASRPRAVISVIASVGELWLLPRLADLADHAGVQIIEENEDPVDFANRGVDIRITYGAVAYTSQTVEVLFHDRMVPVAAPILAAALDGGALLAGDGLLIRNGDQPMPIRNPGAVGTRLWAARAARTQAEVFPSTAWVLRPPLRGLDRAWRFCRKLLRRRIWRAAPWSRSAPAPRLCPIPM